VAIDIFADVNDFYITNLSIRRLFCWAAIYEKQKIVLIENVYAVLQYFSSYYKFLASI